MPSDTSAAPRLLVHMSPVARAGNPYTTLLAQALESAGVRVAEFATGGERPDIVHLHWPEQLLLSRTRARSMLKTARLLRYVDRVREGGTRVVWTGHNALPHEWGFTPPSSRQRRRYLSLIERVDGVVHLSRTGRSRITAQFPALAESASALVDHGDLSPGYPAADRGKARAQLGIRADERLVLFFGRMRSYRGVETALEVLDAAGLAGVRALVAGPAPDDDLAAALRRQAARSGGRIVTELRMLTPLELSTRLAAADLVVQPFEGVLHSGSVILALGAGRRVLAPRLGALPELQDQVGRTRLALYDEPFSSADVESALSLPEPTGAPALGDWSDIAAKHRELYERVLTRPTS